MGSDMVAGDKAYLLDPQALEFVIGDPSSMTLTDFSRTSLFEANADGRFEESVDVTGELLVLLPLRER